jgi:hypothetical protein
MEDKVVRVTPGRNGKVSATDMVIALAKSGVPLQNISLSESLSEADRQFVLIALGE